METNINEVVNNGKKETFQFFVNLGNGEVKAMSLPLTLKESFENRFVGEVPEISEYLDWLNANNTK